MSRPIDAVDPHSAQKADASPSSQISRRGFLRGSASALAGGALLGAQTGCQLAPSHASAVGGALPEVAATIFATPPTLERRGDMPYRRFGRTRELVSLLGVGGYHIGVQASAEESVRVIRTCIDEGVNFLDNAWEYNRGVSETRMGLALQDGYRQKVFLMTKVCGRDRETAMRQLEESLRRLKTDVIDLWQFHECNYDNDPDWIFAADGAVHAALAARQQGKIRYIGFTGHKSPSIHLKMLRQDFDWDAIQMPLNVCDYHYRSFAREVLPLAIERGLGVVGMKSQGGDGRLPGRAGVSVEDCLRYCFSLQIPVCLSGMATVEQAKQNLAIAKSFKPLSAAEREALLAKVGAIAGDGRLERFKSTQDFDSGVHREQHELS
jgi:predicted aldo/keto reductase-like oxidoreductase